MTTIPETPDVMTALQHRIGEWHRERFPSAQLYHVLIQAMDEMGEVAEAANFDLSEGKWGREGSVPDEAADVVIAMAVLVDRWYPGEDLLQSVKRKLAILTDPDSRHRSALTDRSDVTTIPATPDNTAINGTPLGWGFTIATTPSTVSVADDQETWDPDGSGDTHYGVEVDGYPLPPGEDPGTERYLIDRAEHDAHAGRHPESEE